MDIDSFVGDVIIIEAKKDDIYLDESTRDWCKLSYPGHPKGCPSYGRRCICPPDVELFESAFDIEHDNSIYIVVLPFYIGEYAKRMKEKHPDWSERQCRNLLYWQSRVKNVLMNYVHGISIPNRCDRNTLIPEAMGMNVIKTLKRFGVPINVRPKDFLYKVGVCGYHTRKQRSLYDY